jgi:hypothetical protein
MNEYQRFHLTIAFAFARGLITAKQLENITAIYKGAKK